MSPFFSLNWIIIMISPLWKGALFNYMSPFQTSIFILYYLLKEVIDIFAWTQWLNSLQFLLTPFQTGFFLMTPLKPFLSTSTMTIGLLKTKHFTMFVLIVFSGPFKDQLLSFFWIHSLKKMELYLRILSRFLWLVFNKISLAAV